MSSSARAVARVVLALAACAPLAASGGETAIADLSQGTNMTVALAPNAGRLVVGLVDQLWRVPAAGGAAEALTPADETARNPRYSPDGGSIVYPAARRRSVGHLAARSVDGRAARAHQHAARRDRTRVHGRRPRGRIRVEPHGALLPLVGRPRERRGDATDRGVGRRVVPVRFRARSDRVPAAPRDAAGASRVAAVRGHGRARVSQRRSRTAELAPRRRRPGVQRARRHDREPAAHARARRPASSTSRSPDAEDIFFGAPRVAVVSRVHLRVGRPALASRYRVAEPAAGPLVRRARRRGATAARGSAAARRSRARRSRAESPASRRRPTAAGPRSRRSATCGCSERGALRRLTDDFWSTSIPTFAPDGGIARVRERAQRPVRALAHSDLRGGVPSQITFGALQPRHPAVSGDGRRVAFLETAGPGSGSRERLAVAELAHPGASRPSLPG